MSAIAAPALEIRRSGERSRWADVVPDLWSLTKPEVNFLIVIATFTGFYVASSHLHLFPAGRLVAVLSGTLLVASAAGALNQFLEYGHDARMRRTARRPVAAGRLRPVFVLWFGIALVTAGASALLSFVNALACGLALITVAIYLFIYTPLKRKSPLCTMAGAVAGAMPPLIGWAAACGSIASAEAWLLYSLLFFWQFPHFMAIAWMYREDYARAGYVVLPARPSQRFLSWFTVVPSIGLFLTTLAVVVENGSRMLPFFATVILGSGLLYYVRRQLVAGSKAAARRLLKATIFYLI